MEMFNKLNKSKHYTPGFICVLHTFGRPLEWNPHIHCLIFGGGFSDDGFWKKVTHFNYARLRKAFQAVLLNELGTGIDPDFKKVKAKIYRDHNNGFYVYAKPARTDSKKVTEYVGRYLGRPVIVTGRIDEYNESDDTVTFHYNRHEDNVFVKKTIPAMDFIQLLMQHIPEKNFKQIRCYSLYARNREMDKTLRRRRSPEKQRFFISPDELYERARAKYKAARWRSSA